MALTERAVIAPRLDTLLVVVVSDESELVSVCQICVDLGGKLPPFSQRVFSVLLEPVSVVDVAF